MKKKYILTEETIEIDEHILHRIKAIRSTCFSLEGELGGFVESERNLSQIGECWITGNAAVYENARVEDDARVSGFAKAYGHAIIKDKSFLTDQGIARGKTFMHGKSLVCDHAILEGYSSLQDAKLTHNAVLTDAVHLCQEETLGKNAVIRTETQYFSIGPIGSRDDRTTFYKGCDDVIYVSCGCFNGSINEFELEVKATHRKKPLYLKQYLAAIRFANEIYDIF